LARYVREVTIAGSFRPRRHTEAPHDQWIVTRAANPGRGPATVANDRTKQRTSIVQDDKPAPCKAGWGLKDA
jgi:hypothetical protein